MPRRGDNFEKGYSPEFADIVHLDWGPAGGPEMASPHYGLVISATAFNVATGLVVVIPITSKGDKLSNFQLPVSVGSVKGVVLTSSVRALDYTRRDIQFQARAPTSLAFDANKRVTLFLPTA